VQAEDKWEEMKAKKEKEVLGIPSWD